MTCIVAIKENNKIYIGADSAATSNHSITVRKDPKIYKVGEFIFGFTSSYRMGQLLGYKFKPPEHTEEMSVEEYMFTLFIEEIRTVLKNGGYSRIENNIETCGVFIAGYKGRIFTVESDYQVSESQDNFIAIGSGEDIALGSLYSTQGILPVARIKTALSAAEKFNTSVRAPFLVEEL